MDQDAHGGISELSVGLKVLGVVNIRVLFARWSLSENIFGSAQKKKKNYIQIFD